MSLSRLLGATLPTVAVFFPAIQLAPQALDRKSAAKSDDFRPDDLDNMDPEAAWKKNKDCSTASATKEK